MMLTAEQMRALAEIDQKVPADRGVGSRAALSGAGRKGDSLPADEVLFGAAVDYYRRHQAHYW